MKNKIIKGIFVFGISFMLYTSYYAVVDFYTGFHNLDTAQNFLRLGQNVDMNLNNQIISLEQYYRIGLNQMMNGFKWLLFDVILAFILGCIWGFRKEVK